LRQDDKNSNEDIYYCDLSKNGQDGGCLVGDNKIQVTSDLAEQAVPYVYNNVITWKDKRNGNMDVYMCEITLNGQNGGCLANDNKTQVTFSIWAENPSAIFNDTIVYSNITQISGMVKIQFAAITTTSTSTTSTTVPGSITTSTTGGGDTIGRCGDGVVDFGEQCDSNLIPDFDCLAHVGADGVCDVSGIVTNLPCTCFSSNSTSGNKIIIFTTSCQDTGLGDGQGLRTETEIEEDSEGNLISEVNTQVSCTLPPVNVPGFTWINIMIVAGMIFGFYTFKRKVYRY